MLVMPFDILYRSARWELLKTLWNILISPFGQVKFRHFFMADILTSITIPVADICTSVCFFFDGHFLDNTESDCFWLPTSIKIVVVLPYWFRFAQCLNKFYNTRMWFPHLVNAGKYGMSIVVVVLPYFNVALAIMIPIRIIATLYSYSWDIVMDWGFLRSR